MDRGVDADDMTTRQRRETEQRKKSLFFWENN